MSTIIEALPGGGGGTHVARLILKRLVLVFNACRLLSALLSLSQFGRGRLSLVAISFYALSLLFGPYRLSEFTLEGPHYSFVFLLAHYDVIRSPCFKNVITLDVHIPK